MSELKGKIDFTLFKDFLVSLCSFTASFRHFLMSACLISVIFIILPFLRSHA